MGAVVFAVLGFGACSSVMLVVNKLSVHLFPAPICILLLQCASTALSVQGAGWLGIIDVDSLELEKARCFFLVAVSSLLLLFTNIKTLQYCNVETFIVFRCSTGLVMGVAEWVFLGRELPSRRSVGAIAMMCSGAAGYALISISALDLEDLDCDVGYCITW